MRVFSVFKIYFQTFKHVSIGLIYKLYYIIVIVIGYTFRLEILYNNKVIRRYITP